MKVSQAALELCKDADIIDLHLDIWIPKDSSDTILMPNMEEHGSEDISLGTVIYHA